MPIASNFLARNVLKVRHKSNRPILSCGKLHKIEYEILLTQTFYQLTIGVAFEYKNYSKAKNKKSKITPHSTSRDRLSSQLPVFHFVL